MYQLQNSRFWYEFGYVLDAAVQGWACCFHMFIKWTLLLPSSLSCYFLGNPLHRSALLTEGTLSDHKSHTNIPGKCLIRTWAGPLMTCAVKPDWLNGFVSMHQTSQYMNLYWLMNVNLFPRCTNTKDIQTHVTRIEGKKLRQKRHSSGPFNEPTIEPKLWLTHFFPVSECWLQGMQYHPVVTLSAWGGRILPKKMSENQGGTNPFTEHFFV